MQTDSPLVSICIPTYNRAARLEKAVATVLASSYTSLEVIISDNASSDATAELGRKLASQDARIRYFRQECNQGPTRNFAFARAQARGKYFAWLGDDDALDSDYIRACVNALESDAGLIAAAGLGAYHRGNRQTTHYGNILRLESESAFIRVMKYIFQVRENSIFYGIYRRETVSGCSMPNCLAGDWIWISEVLLTGRARVLPEVFVHREFGDSTSATHARIVAILGEPAWHARFRFLAITLNFFRHFGHFPGLVRKPLPVRAAYLATIAAAMSFRSLRYHVSAGLLAVPGIGFLLRKVMPDH